MRFFKDHERLTSFTLNSPYIKWPTHRPLYARKPADNCSTESLIEHNSSYKTVKTPAVPYIEHLPDEILLDIYVRGARRNPLRIPSISGPVTTRPRRFPEFDHYPPSSEVVWEAHLKTLGLVCRRWMALVSPLLYESITIDGQRNDFTRAMLILKSPAPGTPSDQIRGLYVRSLTVSVQFGMEGNRVVRKLLRILRCCTKLRLFNLDISTLVDTNVVRQIWEYGLSGSCSSIESFTFQSYRFGRCSKSMNVIRHLALMTCLTYLVLDKMDMYDPHIHRARITLPLLSVLILRIKHSSLLAVFADWFIPSFRQFALLLGTSQSEFREEIREDAIKSFFRNHGNQLIFLELELDSIYDSFSIANTIMSNCSRLQEIVLPSQALAADGSAVLRHEQIHSLRIEGTSYPLQFSSFGQLITAFFRHIIESNSFPKVTLVQLDSIRKNEVGLPRLNDADFAFWDSIFQGRMTGRRLPEILDADNKVVHAIDFTHPSPI